MARTDLEPTRLLTNNTRPLVTAAANADGYTLTQDVGSLLGRQSAFEKTIILVDRTGATGSLVLVARKGDRGIRDEQFPCAAGAVTACGPFTSAELAQADDTITLDWSGTVTGTDVAAYVLP